MREVAVEDEVSRQKSQFFASHHAAPPAGLDGAEAEMTTTSARGMSISYSEGEILRLFAGLTQARQIVEIGTFCGYSTLWLADALPEGGRLWTFEANKEHAEKARKVFGKSPLGQKIELLEGPAIENLSQLAGTGPVDLVFIDANKAQYDEYFDWAEKHLRPGGTLLVDNSFLFGMAWKEENEVPDSSRSMWRGMRGFWTKLKASPNFEFAATLPTSEGLTVARKKS